MVQCRLGIIMTAAVQIKPKNPRSRYVALAAHDKRHIVAEGRTIKSVMRKANESGKAFSMMYLPPKGNTFIY